MGKKEMGSAVTAASGADEGKGRGGIQPAAARRGFQAYRPGDGYATRLGMMVVIASYVLFACYHFYYGWVFIRDFAHKIFNAIWLGFLTRWMSNPELTGTIAMVGTGIVAGVGLLFGYYYIYVKPSSAEFLIKTDAELGKVSWPKVTPWFKPDTQVWGATYVVLIVVVFMTIFVFGIDMVFQWIAQWLFYRSGAPSS